MLVGAAGQAAARGCAGEAPGPSGCVGRDLSDGLRVQTLVPGWKRRERGICADAALESSVLLGTLCQRCEGFPRARGLPRSAAGLRGVVWWVTSTQRARRCPGGVLRCAPLRWVVMGSPWAALGNGEPPLRGEPAPCWARGTCPSVEGAGTAGLGALWDICIGDGGFGQARGVPPAHTPWSAWRRGAAHCASLPTGGFHQTLEVPEFQFLNLHVPSWPRGADLHCLALCQTSSPAAPRPARGGTLRRAPLLPAALWGSVGRRGARPTELRCRA